MPTSTTKHPRLETGDRLTRVEFHRRYCLRADIKKAELIEGVVYVASPVRFGLHGEPHAMAIRWLGAYCDLHPGLKLGIEATVMLDEANEVQPDACLWREESAGPRLNAGDYLEGAPQLVVEIAASSRAIDLGDKLRAYERCGVAEYIVWLVQEPAIRWHRLIDGHYMLIEPDDAGIIESAVFPGLRLAVPRLLAGDLAAVRAALGERG